MAILILNGSWTLFVLLVFVTSEGTRSRRTTSSYCGVDAFTTTAATTTTATTTTTDRIVRASLVTLYGNSDNIRVAMEMTDMYGIHSPEAKLAWEAVEEFDGRDNSAAYEPRWDRMMSDEEKQRAYEELQYTIEVLQRDRPYSSPGRSRFAHNPQLMEDIASELQSIKLAPPSKKPPPKIPGLWDAKLKARAMSQQYGNDSVEAKLAWEEVEELASAGLDNAIGETTYQTCDIGQAAEACLALEELDRFLYFEDQYNGASREQELLLDPRNNNDPMMAGDYVGGLDDGRYQDSGGSSNYVGGYHDNMNVNGGQYVNNDINNYIDEIDNGRNYQDWDHHYDDDGRGSGGSIGSGTGQSHFDERRSGGYTSYNENPY